MRAKQTSLSKEIGIFVAASSALVTLLSYLGRTGYIPDYAEAWGRVEVMVIIPFLPLGLWLLVTLVGGMILWMSDPRFEEQFKTALPEIATCVANYIQYPVCVLLFWLAVLDLAIAKELLLASNLQSQFWKSGLLAQVIAPVILSCFFAVLIREVYLWKRRASRSLYPTKATVKPLTDGYLD
jgi:hypothetical protein